VIASLSKMAISAVAMAAACFVALRFSGFSSAEHLLSQVVLLVAMILVSVAVYFGLAWLLRCQELSELLLLFRRAEPAAISSGGMET
jgi:hypothetical protein